MNNLPVKTIQYGKTEYDVSYKIYLKDRKTDKIKKYYELPKIIKRRCEKYLFDIDNNKELVEMIEKKQQLFSRFIKLKHKKITKTKKFNVYLSYFTINKGFLEYVKAKEKDVKPFFDNLTMKKNFVGYLPNFNEVFKYKIVKNGIEKRRTIKDGIYNKILIIDDKNINRRVNIKIKKGTIFIDNKKILRHNSRYGGVWLYRKEIIKNNNYNLFISLLKKFYENVNSSNNGWNEYINLKVEKMKEYIKTSSLEDMQKEYEAVRIAKLKQMQND